MEFVDDSSVLGLPGTMFCFARLFFLGGGFFFFYCLKQNILTIQGAAEAEECSDSNSVRSSQNASSSELEHDNQMGLLCVVMQHGNWD